MTIPKPAAIVISRNLPPLVGGMEKLVWHMVDELQLDYQVHVIGPKGCKAFLPPGINVVEVCLKPTILFLLQAKFAALSMSFRYRPALVLAGSGLTAPAVWLAAKLSGARCVAYLHGLDIIVPSKLYSLLWLPVLRRLDGVVVNSSSTQSLAENIGVIRERITLLHPGVTLPDLANKVSFSTTFRTKYKLNDRPVILYVGRIIPRKGLRCFVDAILPNVIFCLPEARLVVIGNEPVDALLSSQNELSKVVDMVRKHGLQEQVIFLGYLSQGELSAAYFAADVLVFPVQDIQGDIEGFGMVAVEAVAHGLPVVAFSTGGVNDAVADGVCGRLIPAGEDKFFAEAVIEMICDVEIKKRRSDCRLFAESFKWSLFGERLREACRLLRTNEKCR